MYVYVRIYICIYCVYIYIYTMGYLWNNVMGCMYVYKWDNTMGEKTFKVGDFMAIYHQL